MHLTDEQIIEQVAGIYALNPNATRNVFKRMIRTSSERLERLHAEGLIKYPPRVHKNMCHLFKKTDKWRNFKLRGSPTGGKIRPTRIKA